MTTSPFCRGPFRVFGSFGRGERGFRAIPMREEGFVVDFKADYGMEFKPSCCSIPLEVIDCLLFSCHCPFQSDEATKLMGFLLPIYSIGYAQYY